jgi:AraC-like DNA-binding protein
LHAQARHLAQDYQYTGKIRDVEAWIENNLKEDLTIEKAASLFGLSRSLLTRESPALHRQEFVDYCNVRRVQKAATILVTEFGSVMPADLESGFSNLRHFHRTSRCTSVSHSRPFGARWSKMVVFLSVSEFRIIPFTREKTSEILRRHPVTGHTFGSHQA